jgi:hypothetical protein
MAAPSEFTKAFAGALSGALGGFVSALVLFPLDVLKTRLQSGTDEGLVEIVRNIVKRDGVLGLWGKTSVILGFQSMIEKFGYFFAYTLLRSLYQRFVGSAPGAIMTLAIGYCSEWCQLPFTIPIDKVTVIMRNRMGTDQPQGLLACAGEVWRAGNLHAGIGGYTLLALKPATQFAAYEPAKAMWLGRQGGGAELAGLASFALGAYSRLVSDSFIYPGRRAKVQKQALAGAEDEESKAMAKMGAVSLCIHMVKTQGLGGLYRGLPTELFRGVLSGALLLLVKERMDVVATRMLLRQ